MYDYPNDFLSAVSFLLDKQADFYFVIGSLWQYWLWEISKECHDVMWYKKKSTNIVPLEDVLYVYYRVCTKIHNDIGLATNCFSKCSACSQIILTRRTILCTFKWSLFWIYWETSRIRIKLHIDVL